MTVYIDNARIRWNPPHMKHRTWFMSHMFADTDEELHAFAAKLGLQRSWHQCPPKASWSHYDVTDTVRKRAVALGATTITYRQLPAMLKEMGRR